MTSELLHLSEHETVRIVRETPQELEVEATWQPGGSSPPPHLHPAQDEHFKVTSGRLTALVDDHERQLGPGDVLDIPRKTPHKMWNPGPVPATAIWRTRPAARTAEWFRTVDRLTGSGTRKPAVPDLARAVIEYRDLFRLAFHPKPVRIPVYLALRLASLASRRDRRD
jgi:mannose-6-phosphate isomerase-like protein (cupin superfamily)